MEKLKTREPERNVSKRMDVSEQLVQWAQRIQSLAQTGLTYAADPYDRQRYEEMTQIAASMLAETLGGNAQVFQTLFAAEKGYATPKIDVRGLLVQEEKVLLVRERSDGLWTLPGGWADVGDTPSHAVEREMYEESGLVAKAIRLLAFYDRNLHGHPPIPYHAYRAFFLCERTGGEPTVSDETDAVDFFPVSSLPPLSLERVTEPLIYSLCEMAKEAGRPTAFD